MNLPPEKVSGKVIYCFLLDEGAAELARTFSFSVFHLLLLGCFFGGAEGVHHYCCQGGEPVFSYACVRHREGHTHRCMLFHLQSESYSRWISLSVLKVDYRRTEGILQKKSFFVPCQTAGFISDSPLRCNLTKQTEPWCLFHWGLSGAGRLKASPLKIWGIYPAPPKKANLETVTHTLQWRGTEHTSQGEADLGPCIRTDGDLTR